MKLRRGSPASDGKPGVSCMRAIEFAAPPRAKRHKTNFTHKDSLPFLFDAGGTKFPHLPLEGEGRRPKGGGMG
jgi:hypothetical protein